MKQKTLSWKQRATLGVSVKNRNDYADYDYLNKLTEKELTWLKAFHREWVNADFQHKYRRCFNKRKYKKVIYAANNARNRCIYNITKWTGQLMSCAVVQKDKDFTSQWYEYL